MSQQDILTLAKQGDPRAIAILLNRSIQPQGITVKAARQQQDLFLLLEAAQVPDEAAMVALTRQLIVSLALNSVRTVRIFGRQAGVKAAVWNHELKLPLAELAAEPTIEPDLEELPGAETSLTSDAELFLPQLGLEENDAIDNLDLATTSEAEYWLSEPNSSAELAASTDELEHSLAVEIWVDDALGLEEESPPSLEPVTPEVSLLEPEGDALDQEAETPPLPLLDLIEAEADIEILEPVTPPTEEEEPEAELGEMNPDLSADHPEAELGEMNPDLSADHPQTPPGLNPAELPALEDFWADTPLQSRSIAAPESMHSFSQQSFPQVSADRSSDSPASPIPPDPPPNSEPAPPTDFPLKESEIRALLQKPEALAVLMVVLLVTLWDAYFQILAEAEAEDGVWSGRTLARRLGTSPRTVRRRRRQADFSEWSQQLDPDGIAWVYCEDGTFIPRP